ncbi:retrograde regulation protein 2 [Coniosporium tulheliwenetii]|uniref:Retrograde regulation protein 2 n=1 Tax=Coniosporium tulheliwenetii TaxID=3383036 RepID=A0ACC2ZM89_9PEZI|nr:retrograde regulation protein 2 [Cladosporium sp. JES 115]
MASSNTENYYALVDMGSNGIRFSITDLAPQTVRILPTVYLDRMDVSLYEVQHERTSGGRVPIPDEVISRVVTAIQRFQTTCEEFGTPPQNVCILATEATRVAANSEAFLQRIHDATGLRVDLLPKEVEGRFGAMGIASSFSEPQGLTMDLGGGSVQLTRLAANNTDVVLREPSPVSLPYGAAALTHLLNGASTGQARDDLRRKICKDLKDALTRLDVPIAGENEAGPSLYVSGGGFRGWGFLLMEQHAIQPYPIPLINGFHVNTQTFQSSASIQSNLEKATSDARVFRVSKRRAAQVPAVAFLISCFAETFPSISSVYFSQGGVREGWLFDKLSPEARGQHPLVAAATAHAPQHHDALFDLLLASLPSGPWRRDRSVPGKPILQSFIQMLNVFSALPKDLRAASALHSTISGVLAGAHGVSHIERALLSLMLCERFGGIKALSATDQNLYERLSQLIAPAMGWWCKYLGRVGAMLGTVHPAGVIKDERLGLEAFCEDGTISLRLRLVRPAGKQDSGCQILMAENGLIGQSIVW